jgi:hypothetical protein
MIAKSLFAAAALATTMTLALPADEARADDWDVNIGVGVGVGVGAGFYPGYYPDYYGDDYYGDDYYYKKKHISCGKGAKIVDHSGFYNVSAYDCGKPVFKYTAWKKGKKYHVIVSNKGYIIKAYKV